MDKGLRQSGSPEKWLRGALGIGEGDSPFPWQQELLKRFLDGEMPSALDLPTGLGKTSVIAIWLVARALGAKVPRRLVYVVDRRAVIDQSTDVAENLRRFVEKDAGLKAALGLTRPLPISTLRGQFVDNREWLEDPSSPAVVVGTVDLVGSRLLFEGYGVSRKMRPYHAGLLGVDALVVLDEAHIVPAFASLLEAITRRAEEWAPRDSEIKEALPPFRFLSLSATGRADANAFTLTPADEEHPIVAKRLASPKRLSIVDIPAGDDAPSLAKELTLQALRLAQQARRPPRVIVFCDRRADAEDVEKRLREAAKGAWETELLVGGRRVFERMAAKQRLQSLGFLAGSLADRTQPAFLIATSAGEVGIDLDADHLVGDLVSWERQIQRFGRVNRRGEGEAEVVIVAPPPNTESEPARARWQAQHDALLRLQAADGSSLQASPSAILRVKQKARDDDELADLLKAATTPPPLMPPLERALLEAWAMTSLEQHTGRPEVEPWLRGWVDEQEPQTVVLWRECLPVTAAGKRLTSDALEQYLELAGPRTTEQLEIESYKVLAWFKKRLMAIEKSIEGGAGEDAATTQDPTEAPRPFRRGEVIGVALRRGERPFWLQLNVEWQNEEVKRALEGATLLLDVRFGGLEQGMLSESSPTATDVTAEAGSPMRVRRSNADTDSADENWRVELRLATDLSEDGTETRWILVETPRGASPESEEGRSVAPTREQLLDDHQLWTETKARSLAERLSLPKALADALVVAAALHDEGKRAKHWQQAFKAPKDGDYAKTKSRPNLTLLAHYRHELGSLPRAEAHRRFQALAPESRPLCLHLIAAHHGFARPVLRTDGAELPRSRLEGLAEQVALRYAQLTERCGPWGLAWLEALLRAADQQASRDNDEGGLRG